MISSLQKKFPTAAKRDKKPTGFTPEILRAPHFHGSRGASEPPFVQLPAAAESRESGSEEQRFRKTVYSIFYLFWEYNKKKLLVTG
jgi:hypothetical protein